MMQSARHAELLEAFSKRQQGDMTGNPATEGAEQLSLILEVVDILGELNILILLFEKQAGVVSDVRRKCSLARSRNPQQDRDASPSYHFEERPIPLGGFAGYLMQRAMDRLSDKKAVTERLRGEVIQTHKLVSCLRLNSVVIRRVAYHAAGSSWN